MNAEGYYSKALAIDHTFTDAEEALNKVRQCIQVILYFLFFLQVNDKWEQHLHCCYMFFVQKLKELTLILPI